MTFYPISTYTLKTSRVDLHRPKVNAYRTIPSTESMEKMIIMQFQIMKILNDAFSQPKLKFQKNPGNNF